MAISNLEKVGADIVTLVCTNYLIVDWDRASITTQNTGSRNPTAKIVKLTDTLCHKDKYSF